MFTLINICAYVSRMRFSAYASFSVQKIMKQLWQTFPTRFRTTTYIIKLLNKHHVMPNIQHIIYWTHTSYIKHISSTFTNTTYTIIHHVHRVYSTYTTYTQHIPRMLLVWPTSWTPAVCACVCVCVCVCVCACVRACVSLRVWRHVAILLDEWWIADYETLHVCRVPRCQQCVTFWWWHNDQIK